MNRDRALGWLCLTAGFLLLIFSLYTLHQQLNRYNIHDILNSLSAIDPRALILALGFAIASYLVISSYDLVAFWHFNHYLDIKRILFTTFLTYAVSNTTGFTLLIGGGIRYRFYSLWGVPAKTIAKVTAWGNLTFWLGLLTLIGISFTIDPLRLPNSFKIDLILVRCLGFIALTSIGTYLYFCYRRKRWRIRGRTFAFPNLITSAWQITIFSLDWALAAAILYSLIFADINKSYWQFFSIYLLAMAASIISNVPGGIGVFETIIIFLLPKSIYVPDILSSLLVYRTIRFLLPLAIALIAICIFELKQRLSISRYK